MKLTKTKLFYVVAFPASEAAKYTGVGSRIRLILDRDTKEVCFYSPTHIRIPPLMVSTATKFVRDMEVVSRHQ